MSRREEVVDIADIDLSRRELLGGVVGGGLTLGGGKAVDNIFVGYGILTGTNLLTQDLERYVRQRFPTDGVATTLDGYQVGLGADAVTVRALDGTGHRVPVEDASVHGLPEVPEPVNGLVNDLSAIGAGEFEFAFSQTTQFFDRIAGADARPATVDAVRGVRFRTPPIEVVRRFADTDPAAVAPMVEGLAWGFREFSRYDFARYAAGSVEDNVLFGAGDLRDPFRSPAGFEGLLVGENTGLFCYEFAYRSIEAFHAVPPTDQSVPVLGAVVTDARHKHVYTGIASVIREGGNLVVPMTFVDYTHSTLYDDFGFREVLDEGIEAYNDRHRTTDVFWNRYARW